MPATRTWLLLYRHRDPFQRDRALLQRALEAVVGPLRVEEGPWEGNPRDHYGRNVTGTGSPRPGVTLRVDLGVEHAMGEGPPDPEAMHFERPLIRLTGPDLATLEALRTQLATALAAAGYDDVTTDG